jgi:predicted CXXCH cytochrome family protein
MKKSATKTMLLVMITIVSVLMVAQITKADIVGSKHDLRTYGGATGTDICVYCHTPHAAQSQLVPLWSHATTGATFTLYGSTGKESSTLNATIGLPGGVSKACLSCHDGTVAVDSYRGTTGTKIIASGLQVGPDLTNDHPIGFAYNAALVTSDGGLENPATVVSAGLPLFGSTAAPSVKDQLECATCHNVHRTGSIPSFLRVSNTASALCLTCHKK